ncbi:MAG: PAS domain S-box protein [Deltaproteobacteria bacterium]|nr:PAS domain S-box protein [Candidatus Tharpellaceae bacterium]
MEDNEKSKEQLISELNELRETEKRNRLLLEMAGEGVLGFDRDGLIDFTNQAAEKLLGYQTEELLGKNRHALIHHTRADGTPYAAKDCLMTTAGVGDSPRMVDDEVLWRKDGSFFPAEYTAAPLLKGGQFVGTIVTFRDISKRIEAQKTFAEKTSILNNILQNSIDCAIFTTDLDLRITYCNSLAEKYYGYTATEVIGKTVMEMHARDKVDAKRLTKAIEEVRRSGEYLYTIEQETENGTCYLDTRVTGILDDADKISGYVLSSRDITEETSLFKSLQESEKNFRAIYENMTDIYYRTDKNEKLVEVSSVVAAVELYRCNSIDDIIGKPIIDFYYDENDRQRFLKELREKGYVKNFPVKFIRTDGQIAFVELGTNIVFDNNGNPDGTVGVLRDITEQKEAEDRLLAQKQLLETIINAIPGIICIKDEEGCWLLANNYTLNLFQLEGVDYHGKSGAELALFNDFHKDTFLVCMDSDNIAWEKGRISQGEETIPKPDGSSLVFDITKIPLFNPDGSRHALAVVGHDITLRKKQELILQQMVEEQIRDISKKQNRLVQLYDELDQIFNAALPMAVIDRDLTFVRVNDPLCNYVGMKKEDLIGKHCCELYNAEYCFTKDCTLCQLQDGSSFVQREIDRCLPDGKPFVCTVRSSPFCDSDGKILGFICSFFDQYEKKMTEKELQKTRQQLIHADKLSAVGRLSASIAHEFNNPLFGVINVLNGIKGRTNLVENDQRMIEMAIKECQRMKLLIRELKCFNRPSSGKKVLFDLHQSIDEILLFHQKDLKIKKINIVKEYDPDLPKIWAVEDQIKQVFINLINNAAAALEDKSGTVIIATRLKADSAMISITDTGVGIRPDHKDHIFEPFFSTKKQVKGTGLGLSVSYGIIKSHGGDIVVDSEPGMGATFTIILPINSAFHKGDEKS